MFGIFKGTCTYLTLKRMIGAFYKNHSNIKGKKNVFLLKSQLTIAQVP